ncbi:MAG: phenylacetic acid degradation protein [Lysobacteraceae bacterium]|nr:MAG: phenylacetic acid degradation protein [Xanthomonadaceae bacterium]
MSALFDAVLRLADSNLILGQRLSEWCAKGPQMEEDVALTNVALDLIGHANLLLGYAAEIEGKGQDADQLAFLRDGDKFHNLLLVEQPNGDYAHTIARQLFFDAWANAWYAQMAQSSDQRLAEIAARALKETRYHWRHSTQWALRLGDGTEESHQRMQAAIDALWMFTGELFADDEVDVEMAEQGIMPLPSSLAPQWNTAISAVLEEATLSMPGDQWMQSGGKQGRHTEHLGYILAEMQFLPRAYPGAAW